MDSIGNSTSTVLAMGIAVILIIVVPMVTLTARVDNVTEQNAQLIVEEFVTDLANTGILTRAKYENLKSKLNAIGVDDIEMEIHLLDENPGKKTAQANYKKIGENVYLIIYETQIDERLSKEDAIILSAGDRVALEAKSINPTAHQTATSSILGFSNADESAISVSSSAMVTEDGVKD